LTLEGQVLISLSCCDAILDVNVVSVPLTFITSHMSSSRLHLEGMDSRWEWPFPEEWGCNPAYLQVRMFQKGGVPAEEEKGAPESKG
jgi:hypothetical protein